MTADETAANLRRHRAVDHTSRRKLIRELSRARKMKEFEELAQDLRSDEDAGPVEDPDELLDDQDFDDAVRE